MSHNATKCSPNNKYMNESYDTNDESFDIAESADGVHFECKFIAVFTVYVASLLYSLLMFHLSIPFLMNGTEKIKLIIRM